MKALQKKLQETLLGKRVVMQPLAKQMLRKMKDDSPTISKTPPPDATKPHP
jgi:hypothetical protein